MTPSMARALLRKNMGDMAQTEGENTKAGFLENANETRNWREVEG